MDKNNFNFGVGSIGIVALLDIDVVASNASEASILVLSKDANLRKAAHWIVSKQNLINDLAYPVIWLGQWARFHTVNYLSRAALPVHFSIRRKVLTKVSKMPALTS